MISNRSRRGAVQIHMYTYIEVGEVRKASGARRCGAKSVGRRIRSRWRRSLQRAGIRVLL